MLYFPGEYSNLYIVYSAEVIRLLGNISRRNAIYLKELVLILKREEATSIQRSLRVSNIFQDTCIYARLLFGQKFNWLNSS